MTSSAISSDASEDAGRVSSNQIFQSFLDSTFEAVLVVDASLRVVASNQAARVAFSGNLQNIAGRRLSEVTRDMLLHTAFQDSLENRRRSDIRFEIAGTRETQFFEVHIAPIGVGSDQLAIGFFKDISRVERLEKVRQEFLSNISHELRTPLTSILAFVETLADGAVDDPENNRRFLDIIRRNAERMHNLVTDILELSLIESGKISIEITQVHLYDLVKGIFDSLESKAGSRNVTLKNQVQPETVVCADPRRLEQMLINLIDNAVKFDREGGCVTVNASIENTTAVITVADTGEGIGPDHLSRIFERFYRLDRGRSREVGGTGLGLAIVKHLARLHGGEISVASELGAGTVFSIQLPQ